MALGSLSQPNIIILMTDQQRQFQYFPTSWINDKLPSMARLENNGVSFSNCNANSLPCTASRGALISGKYPLTTGVLVNNDTLQPQDFSIPKIMNDAGYDMYYKGKWHLNGKYAGFSNQWPYENQPAITNTMQAENSTMNSHNLKGWTSPDFGTDLVVNNPKVYEKDNLGGGVGNNDGRIVNGSNPNNDQEVNVVTLLDNVINGTDAQPFCLVVSMLNPHDVSVYPNSYVEVGYGDFNPNDSEWDDFELPASYSSDNLSNKPSHQLKYLDNFDGGQLGETTALEYLKFYAYLQKKNEVLYKDILDKIESDTSLYNNTIIIRMADHGEMGCSHYGLREKENVAYREALNVPMIFSNPTLWTSAQNCDAQISLMDLAPTLASIVGVDPSSYDLQGVDFSSLLLSPNDDGADYTCFTIYNKSTTGGHNMFGINTSPTYSLPSMKYVVWFDVDSNENIINMDSMQFELYDVGVNSDGEVTNLASLNVPSASSDYPSDQVTLHSTLTTALGASGSNVLPSNWPSTLPVVSS